MRFSFTTNDLAELYQSGMSTKLHPNIVKAFRRAVDIIASAPDERALRGIKSLHMEKLRGNREGQYSIRLNDQYRLVFSIESDGHGNFLLIIEMVDYH
jgi:proteic killer suppression protein